LLADLFVWTMLHHAQTGVTLVASPGEGVVAAEEALIGDVVVVEVDEEVAVVDSMTEDVVDQEAVSLQIPFCIPDWCNLPPMRRVQAFTDNVSFLPQEL
jgi:hypothetical protein